MSKRLVKVKHVPRDVRRDRWTGQAVDVGGIVMAYSVQSREQRQKLATMLALLGFEGAARPFRAVIIRESATRKRRA